MTLVLLIYLIAPLVLVLFMYLSGTRSLRKLITVPVAFYSLPVLVVVGLYVFRTPIQQGKVMAELGPILSLVFPAEDLYIPLATTELVSGKNEYTLRFTHKYVGHHAVEISIPGKVPFGKLEPELQVSLEVLEGDTLLYRDGPVKGSGFWGRNDHGLHFSWYGVPEDLPVARSLTARITMSGDLNGFLREREGTTLNITKVSDE
jgi:hypothetical protein